MSLYVYLIFCLFIFHLFTRFIILSVYLIFIIIVVVPLLLLQMYCTSSSSSYCCANKLYKMLNEKNKYMQSKAKKKNICLHIKNICTATIIYIHTHMYVNINQTNTNKWSAINIQVWVNSFKYFAWKMSSKICVRLFDFKFWDFFCFFFLLFICNGH